MNKFYLIGLHFLFISLSVSAQSSGPQLYDPEADAATVIQEATELARETGKHVFLQVGGNWCSWCIKFHRYIEADSELDSLQQANYVVRKVNYSRENTNDEVLAGLEFPQRFGFPVFVILDASGKRIHTQNSGLLESEGGYSNRRIKDFFLHWSPAALQPDTYKRN